MVDVADTVPPAMDVDGNLVIWWLTTIADLTAVKASTEIGGAGSTRLTHSFTPGGFNLGGSQAKNPDERLALLEVLETLGKVTRSLSLEYVDSADVKGAAVVLKPTPPAESKSGFFVVRPMVSNKVIAAAAQTGYVIPATVGKQMRPVTGSGKFLVMQEVVITGPVVDTVFAA